MEWELAIREIISPDSAAINWWQMVTRGIFILMFSLMLAQLGDNRIFGMSTAFDIALAVYTHMGKYIKGQEKQLINNGRLQKEVMCAQLITGHDILEAVRQKGRTQQLKEVAAFLERDGSISIIPKNYSLNYTNSNCR